ncbi:universal stress protein [Halomarina pelagica]|uniref:universal stress protein n=1 Tax=Halomarina pelagica TaxID=2961599 RepID=UPI0020C4443B|nr:universal stress protein [Halomarina sp. BND7]
MYDDILVPTDGSDEAATALGQAFDLARTYDATVHVLYVVDDSRGDSGLMGLADGDPLASVREEGRDAVEAIARRARDADVTVTTAVRQNLPHEGIREYADEHDVDLIVMSSRGRSGVSRVLFGSVTERVLRLSERPVLVVSRTTPPDDGESD